MKGIFFNKHGFSSPVLGEEAQKIYLDLYGEAGEKFVDILNTFPNEIVVISRLIAYLKEKRRVINMMDIQKTEREIVLLETAVNLSKVNDSIDVIQNRFKYRIAKMAQTNTGRPSIVG